MTPHEELLAAAKKMVEAIEQNPGGYDWRPFYALSRNPLIDTQGAIIRLREAVRTLDPEFMQPREHR